MEGIGRFPRHRNEIRVGNNMMNVTTYLSQVVNNSKSDTKALCLAVF